MDSNEWKLREDICEAGRRLYHAGFMAGSDGNLSVRLNDDEILISPSRLCKGYLEPLNIIKVDRKGKVLSGELPPSLELSMHLAAFEERPDIAAVIHSHPPILVAFTLVQQRLPNMVLPEIEVLFGGNIPIAPYATPGTPELGDSIRSILRHQDTCLVILDHHGTLAVGHDLFQAVMRTEHAENAAKVIYYAKQLGPIQPLPVSAAEGLKKTRSNLLSTEASLFSTATAGAGLMDAQAMRKKTMQINHPDIEGIVQKVLSEVRGLNNGG